VNSRTDENGDSRKQLKDAIGRWLDSVLVAAREAPQSGASAPEAASGAAGEISNSVGRHQHIYEALAEALALSAEPKYDPYEPAEVRAAFDLVFPGKSGPPADEWLDWLHRRVEEISGGKTLLVDDKPPRSPRNVLFRAYYGKLKGPSKTRRILLTPAGLEYIK
jgi:hypothetical protein